MVTYRAVDKFGNTGVCQVQLLAEGKPTVIDERSSLPWQPTVRPKPQAKPGAFNKRCENIGTPKNGQTLFLGSMSLW